MEAGKLIKELLEKSDKEILTPDITRAVESLYSHPNCNVEINVKTDSSGNLDNDTVIELLCLFNYPLVKDITQMQFNCLRWILGVYNRTPFAGKFGDLKIDSSGKITGRPNFSSYTLEELNNNPTQARRHIFAWHLIRNMMNDCIGAGGITNTANSLEPIFNNNKVNIPSKIVDQAETLLNKMPLSAFTYQQVPPDNVKFIFKCLFIMNSNPKNLWLGNSVINSQLPGIYVRTVEALKNTKTLNGLIEKARKWNKEVSNTVDSTAHKIAAYSIVEYYNEISKEDGSEDVKFQFLLNKAVQSLMTLEIDITPGSPTEQECLEAPNRQAIISLGILLFGEDFSLENASSLFNELLIYNPS